MVFVFFIVSLLVLAFVGTFNKQDIKSFVRKTQALEFGDKKKKAFRPYKSFMSKIETRYKLKGNYAHKKRIETDLAQAGFKYKYFQFQVFSIAVGIGLAVLSYILIRNEFLFVSLVVFGRFIPPQILEIIKNKRILKVEKQVGPFMQIITKRYLLSKDMEKSIRSSKKEFAGVEPMHSEILIAIAELDAKTPSKDVLSGLALRTSNKYLQRYADYYEIASKIGTAKVRQSLLSQAYEQYKEDFDLKVELKKKIAEPVRDSYIMVMSLPVFMSFGMLAIEGYMDFILYNIVGKIMVSVVVCIVIFLLWVINKKIGAPIK